ncbi:MAG: TIGR03862 family flavoprotein [Alphaproteobacteria bacterium]|nr:TIGR03862 family flavoprotein [Alphaproteobacteria bacterium]MBU0799196.1 TIGR03862 family flavoprotein [Alphaproteobacteria bacterium]MBU0887553.1 TIGR03862 family flavoprotein [Alphaproteobacteria bacterium]MBU1814790.1 TIGR03862 family flavoprotein [Alphaproteobacteria bacterium]MBU2091166.1 TIGR03862 family flavoprotein [Alphaproteobacteria bacterium]
MAQTQTHDIPLIAVIGGGPAGLMAAETLLNAGLRVALYERMPSVGRKFLMAGKSGLNLTHSEVQASFVARYGEAMPWLRPILESFGPQAVRDWAGGLGVDTFIGSSGRVFPTEMKAAPLLRAWVRRLRGQGAVFHMRHRWTGWDSAGALLFETPAGELSVRPAATVLALGGGSWPQLGSDAAWMDILAGKGVPCAALRPSNCGFDIAWSEHFRSRFAGHPVKPVSLGFEGRSLRGEFVITETGIEGSGVYAHSAALVATLDRGEPAALTLDLAPDTSLDRLTEQLRRPRGSQSMSNHLRKVAGIEGVKAGLLREYLPAEAWAAPDELARAIKALSLPVQAPRPIAEAISTSGGISQPALAETLMLKDMAGYFCAGEMLDWDAPTGGYLLTACLALGKAAGQAAADWAAANRE